jgi:hypothetical protein
VASTKCLPINLPVDMYQQLDALAQTQERDAVQQARWMLKQAIQAAAPSAGETKALPAAPPTGAAE